jgi:hypothetical protein
LHTEVFGVDVSTGVALMVTTTVLEVEQPEVVPTTVYVVVEAGVALIVAPEVLLNPMLGDHA